MDPNSSGAVRNVTIVADAGFCIPDAVYNPGPSPVPPGTQPPSSGTVHARCDELQGKIRRLTAKIRKNAFYTRVVKKLKAKRTKARKTYKSLGCRSLYTASSATFSQVYPAASSEFIFLGVSPRDFTALADDGVTLLSYTPDRTGLSTDKVVYKATGGPSITASFKCSSPCQPAALSTSLS